MWFAMQDGAHNDNPDGPVATHMGPICFASWVLYPELTTCEIPRDDLFSDDFGNKINTLVSNLAHIVILRRPLIILFKKIVYLEGILHFRQWKPWKLGVNNPTIGISQKVHSFNVMAYIELVVLFYLFMPVS
jgi:hypothetical protein